MGSVTLTVVPKGKSQGDLIAKAQRQQLFSGANKAIEQARKTFFNVKGYDRNKDGLVQEDEIPQRMRNRILTRFDKNQDRVLDAEEQPALQEYLNGILGGRVRSRAR